MIIVQLVPIVPQVAEVAGTYIDIEIIRNLLEPLWIIIW